MVLSYFANRNAKYWERIWKFHFLHNCNLSGQSAIGKLNWIYKNISNQCNYFASQKSIDKIAKDDYPFEDPNEEQDGDEKNYEYYGKNDITELKIYSKDQIDELFKKDELIHNITCFRNALLESSSGEFSIQLLNLLNFEENPPTCEFSKIVAKVESFLRKFIKVLLNDWWIASRRHSNHQTKEDLILKTSKIDRKKWKDSMLIGHAYKSNTINTISISYQTHNQQEIIICSFTIDKLVFLKK